MPGEVRRYVVDDSPVEVGVDNNLLQLQMPKAFSKWRWQFQSEFLYITLANVMVGYCSRKKKEEEEENEANRRWMHRRWNRASRQCLEPRLLAVISSYFVSHPEPNV